MNKLDIEVKHEWEVISDSIFPEQRLEATWNNRKFGTIKDGVFVPTQFKDEAEILLEIVQAELGGVQMSWWG